MKESKLNSLRIGICFLFLVSYSTIIWAQIPSFQSITSKDGLSQNSVTSIVQDSFGFIWIATQDGLNKYDGTNFTKYDAYFTDITQEDFSRIGKIYLDSSNRLWLINSDGIISYFDDPSATFFHIDTLANASVILEKKEDEFWIGSYTEGLFLLSISRGRANRTPLLPNRAIYNITTSNSDLLLATDQGVIRYNTITSESESLYKSLSTYHISDILGVEDGRFLISTFRNGLFKSNASANVERVEGLSNHLRIQDLLIDQNEKVWIATYNDGVYTIDGNVISHLSHNPPTQNHINYNDILCLYEDRKQNIWLGTDGGGVSLNKANQKPIYSITNDDTPREMAVDVTRSISTDAQGNIWIGTSGKGLTVVDRDKSNLKHYSKKEDTPYTIPSDRIMSLMHNKNDDLWIGTQEGGLLYYNENSKIISEINSDFPAKTIWDMLPKDEHQFWICSRLEGLILYNSTKNTWKQYQTKKNLSLRVIVKDIDQYYIGTDEGDLLRFDEVDGKFTSINLNTSTGGIKALYVDGDHIWIGTQRKGILVLNKRTNEIRTITEQNGLPNKVVYSLLNQNNRYLWSSTNKGLSQIDKVSFYNKEDKIVSQILNYNNGLIGNEFNTGAYYQDENGVMYFGGINGVNWFDPNTITTSDDAIKVAFLELTTSVDDNKEIITLYNKRSVELPYKNRHFQIRYTDLEFDAEENILFRYRLSNYNEEWIQNESNKLISFSNVPPGKYTLQIKASKDNTKWDTEIHKIEINITPAFWQTWIFSLLLAGALISISWYLINLRIANIRQAARLQQDLIQSEATALKAQMNPHFLFNSLNAIDNYILNNDAEKASNYLSKFSKLIRQILDYSDQPRITLQQEIEILTLYVKMEQLRFPSKFEFAVLIDPNINTNDIKVPPLLIQPFVENAIWHGLMHLEGSGKLSLGFEKNEQFLICEIIDNGIGRVKANEIKSKSATKRKSHGLKITNDRIRLLNELKAQSGNFEILDLYSEFNIATGTKVIIRLPL